MRILTRTYPPSSNPNYGGILQAWALQTALLELGHDVFVDSTRSSQPSFARRALKQSALSVLKALSYLGLDVPGRQTMTRKVVNSKILEFPQKHIREVALYRGPGAVDRQLLESFDAFLVGSDQVWRPAYVDVPSFMLNFLPDDSSQVRVAYAASFGRGDDSEYDADLRETTASLARRFHRISTREHSGVSLAQSLWGVAAEQMPDPTLLHPISTYESLMPKPARETGLMTYLLDSSPERKRVVDAVSSRMGKTPTSILPETPGSLRALRRDPDRYRKPSVEEWLGALSGSDFVVTDSFHGMVFSILFNKDFIVIPNEKRGRARFDDLLQTFGLSDRVTSTAQEAAEIAERSIDWSSVNRILENERQRGIRFLTECFGQKAGRR